MQAIARPVKLPTINVGSFVESYGLILSRHQDAWQSNHGLWWSNGVLQGTEAEADTEALDEAVWQTWWQHLTNTLEAIEKDYGFTTVDHPLFPEYATRMAQSLEELAKALAPLITETRKGEILSMARGYASHYVEAIAA